MEGREYRRQGRDDDYKSAKESSSRGSKRSRQSRWAKDKSRQIKGANPNRPPAARRAPIPHASLALFTPARAAIAHARSCFTRRSAAGAEEDESFGAFISYYRNEAGCDARLLKDALSAALNRPVFLDTSNADDIRAIVTRGVRNSDALVLLLTEHVLARPWVLLEAYEALRIGKPIVPVLCEGRGYDFGAAEAHMRDLARYLERTNPGSAATLRSLAAGRGLQFSRLQAALVTSLPQIIAVKFKPDGSERQLEATTKDVVARIASAKAHPPPPLMEKDLKQFNRFSLKHIGLGVRATTGAGAVPRISEARWSSRARAVVEESSVAASPARRGVDATLKGGRTRMDIFTPES